MNKLDVIQYCVDQRRGWNLAGELAMGSLYSGIAHSKAMVWDSISRALRDAEQFHTPPREMIEGDL